MLINTRSRGFPLTDAIIRHVEAKVESALGPFARRIVNVTVRVEDVNADRGGIDKRCSIVVALRSGQTEVAEAVAADLYDAIDEAARRIRRQTARVTKLYLTRDRRDAQRPGTLLSA